MSLRRGRKPAPPSGDAIPDKLFFKIGEVARLTGLAPYVLRYWETEFPQLRPRKGQGGQRVYRREDVLQVLQIQRMLHREGFTIAGARRRLAKGGQAASDRPAPDATAPPAVRKAREGLQELLDLMENTDSHRADNRTDPGRGAVR